MTQQPLYMSGALHKSTRFCFLSSLLTILLTLFTADLMYANQPVSPPNWTVDPGAYQYSMSINARVQYLGVPTNAPGNMVGVFVGNELRGVATPVAVSGDMYYFITVYSNLAAGENLKFKVYYQPDDAVYVSLQSLSFTANQVVGDIPTPYWISVDNSSDLPPYLSPIPNDTTIVSIPFETINLANYFVSDDGDPVVYSAVPGANLNASVSGSILTVSPVSGTWTGTDTVRVIVTEQTSNMKTASTTPRFTVNPYYVPPVLNTIPSQSINVGQQFVSYDLDSSLVFTGSCRAYDYYITPFSGSTANPGWSPPPPGSGPMTVTARALFDDIQLAGSGSQLAAFLGSTLIGTANPSGTAPNITYTLTLANLGSGNITFQFYDASRQYLYTLNSNLAFVSGGSAGTTGSPYLVQFCPLTPTINSSGVSSITINDNSWLGTLPVNYVVSDCAFPSLTSRRDTSAGSYTRLYNPSPTITSSSSVSFQENTCLQVYNTQAYDPNFTEGNGLTYSITGGADQSKFNINASTGVLTWSNFTPDFEAPADADANNIYLVNIQVINPNMLTGQISLAVTVTNNTVEGYSPAINGGATICLSSSVVLTASGGGTYLWSTGQTTSNIGVTAIGTYTVTVTNNVQCTGVASAVVNQTPAVSLTGSSSLVCIGDQITLLSAPSGGTSPYTFSWSGPNSYTSAVEDPPPFAASQAAGGTYRVTVTDNKGCTVTGTQSVVYRSEAKAVLSLSASSPVCVGAPVTLTVTPTGGTTPYSYAWSGPNSFTSSVQNPAAFSALTASAGTYRVNVTTSGGCVTSATGTVVVNTRPAVTVSGASPVCQGSNVVLTSSTSGGTTPYTYLWAGPNSFTSSIAGPTPFAATLAATGTYTVTVTDANNCTNTGTRAITVSTTNVAPTVSTTGNSPVCAGVNIQLTSTASGGSSSSFTYSWSGPAGFTSSVQNPVPFAASAGAAGTYTVTVTSAVGCAVTATRTIQVNTKPTVTASSNSPVCVGSPVLLTSTPQGGAGGFTFAWTGPAAFTSTVEDPASFVASTSVAGNYTITVTDANGCTGTATTALAVRTLPVVSVTTGPTCLGNNLSLSSTTSGGTSPYVSYAWSGPNSFSSTQEDPAAFSLTAQGTGTYTVIVTDNSGCTATGSSTIVGNNSPAITALNSGPICQGTQLTLTSTPQGGTGTYTFSWTGPAGTGYTSTTQNPAAFTTGAGSAGAYSVQVTDANGCTGTGSTTAALYSLPVVTVSNNGPFCIGSTALLTSVVTGGAGSYSYAWSGPSGFTSSVANPAGFAITSVNQGGTYSLTVTDANGCTSVNSTSVTVFSSGIPSVSIGSNSPVCTSTTLNLTATPSGGAGFYSGYSWTGPSGFTSTQQNPVITGATSDYSGLYTVTLTDLTGCTASVSASVTVSGANLSISKTNVTCSGGNTGSATLSLTGGTPPYSYLWSTAATTSTISSLVAGTYTVTITPGSGVCTQTASVQITQPTAILVTLASSTMVCAGSLTGSATVSVSGGTSPYTYLWPVTAGSQTTAMASNLPAGSYTVTVTDNVLCTSTLAVTISVITDITAPTITCVAGQTKGTASPACTYTASGTEFNLTASSDNCGVTTTTYNLSGATTATGSSSLAGVVFNKGITTVQWTAVDAASNNSTCSFTVTVNDDDAPGVVCVSAKTKGTSAPLCTYTASGTEFNPVSSSDNCAVTATTWTLSGVTIGTGSSSLAGVIFNKGVTTVEWGVSDAAVNTGSCSFTVTVNDDDNPLLSCIANQTKGTIAPACTYTSSGTEFNLTASSDNCGVTLTTYTLAGATSGAGSNSLSTVIFNKGITTVQWSVADAAGNTSTCSFSVTVNDDDSPVPSCITAQTKTTDAPACTYTTSGTEFDLTGSLDNCAVTTTTYNLSGATTSTGSNSLSGVIFSKGVTTVRWTVSDAAGNTGACTFAVTVSDDDAPGVVCVPAKTKGTVAPLCTYTASGTEFNPTGSSDNCAVTATTWTLGGVTTGTGSNSLAGVIFNSGITTVEWKVSDAAGNTGTCAFTVTVNDDDVPMVTCVPSKTKTTAEPTCTYTASGNEFNPAGSSDNCGVAATTCTLSGATVSTGGSSLAGTVFNKGLTTVIWKVSDAAGNTGTCSFTVTVNDDDVPTAVCNNLTVNLDPVTAQATVSATQLTVNSSDACGSITSSVSSWGLNPATCAGAVCLSGGASFPILRNGPGTGTYQSTSCLGSSRNESWFYFQVTSAGTVNQTIGLSPAADVDYACWGPFPSVVAGCGNLIPANQKSCDYSAANGGTMNFTAATGYYIIVVTNFDNQTGSVMLGNNSAGTATIAACGSLNTSQPSYVYDPSDIGQNTVTVRVTDAAGNSSTCTSVVTVQVVDTTPPVALCKNISVNLMPDNTVTVRNRDIDNGSTDNIAISSFALSKSQFACADIGSSVITMTVTDLNGNTGTCSATVTVNDMVPPLFADPSDVSLNTNASSTCPTTASISLTASQLTPVATGNTSFTFTVHGKTQSGPTSYSDNCATGSDIKLYCWAIDNNFGGTANTCSRQIQVTWRVYDKNNANYTEQTQKFTIQDNTIPSFTRPADITINTDATCTPNRLPANTGDVTNESDNCSSAIQATYTDGPNIALTCAGEYYFNRTWSLQDNCGNAAASQVQRITVRDRTSPVVSTTDNVLNPDIENYNCGASYTFNAGPQLCFLNKTITKPEWVDACGGLVTTAFVADNNVTVNNYGSFVSADFPVGTTIVTFTAQDCPGNTALCSLTITINDTQNPTLSGCPQSQTLATDPNSCARVLTLVIPTASDNCAVTSVKHTLSGATTLTGNEFPNQLSANFGVTTVTYVVLDAAGNARTCTFVVTINDQIPPAITCPSDKTVSTNQGVCYHTITNGQFNPAVSDNCSATSAYSLTGQTTGSGASSLNGININKGLSTVVWTATDTGGNTATCSFKVTVNDTEAPVSPADAGATISCLSAAVTPTIPQATDNCSGSLSTTLVSVADNPVSITCEGTRTYTYRYTDAAGNSDNWVFTYTVEYQDFNMPANAGSTVACIAQTPQPSPPAVNDNCGNALTPSGPVTGGTYTACEGTRTYTWTYTDCEGNSHPWVYTYTIERNDFSVPANGSSTVSCIALATAPVPPAVNDNCGNALTPSGPVTGGTYTNCEGTRTYTYTYTDCEGNTHPWVYTYTIERENFTMPPDGSMTTGCLAQAIQPVPPAVNDHCGNPVIPVGPVVSDNYNGCEGTRTYIWIYADCEGNSYNWSYVYTIERENFTIPAENSPVTVSCLSQIPPQIPPAASDACGNNIVPTGPVTGGTYNGCEGTRTYTWTYTDCEGNSKNWTSYYVIDDNVPPVVSSTNSTFNPDIENYSCGASYTFMAGQSACIINKSLSLPVWTDNCSGNVSSGQITNNGIVLSQLGDILIGNFPVGQTVVTFRAFDCAGNMSTCSLRISVNDVQNPTISGCPTSKLENTDAGTCTKTSSLVIPTPGDNCAVSSVTYSVTGSTTQSGTEFPNQLTFNIGLSTVTYAVFDPAGNSATCSFSVVISDNQPLAMVCPSNKTVNTDTGLCTYKAAGGNFDATITDNCPIAAQSWTLTGATAATGSGTINDVLFSKGVTTVRWSAVDQGGTSKSCSFTVTVSDNQAPVIPAGASSTVSCISAMTTPIPPTGQDNCDGTITGVLAGITNTPSTLSCEGTRVYSYTYTDAGGNVATWRYTYTLEREDFNMPPDQSSQVSCPSLALLPAKPVVLDHCGNPVTPVGPAFGGTFDGCEGTITYTWVYTDCEGNSHPWVYTYQVERENFPVPQNGNSTVSCVALATQPAPPVILNQCGNQTVPSGPVVGGNYDGCEGTVSYTWIYTDCEGNSNPWTYTYTVERISFQMPANGASTVSCILLATPPTPPAVNDQCGNPITPVGPTAGGTYTTCEGTRTYTWVYTDCEGNSRNWVYTYTIERDEFAVPANGSSTVSCPGNALAPTPPAVNDHCGNAIIPVGPSAGGTYTTCEGTRTYTWVYTDCEGNSRNWTYTYTIDDNTAPVVSSTNSPSSPDIKDYSCGATFTYPAGQSTCIINKSIAIPTWTDDCGGSVVRTFSTNSSVVMSQIGDLLVGNFPTGTTVVRFTGTDCAGNSSLCTIAVVVQDGQLPTITGCPQTNITTATDPNLCTKMLSLVIPTAGDNCAVAAVTYSSTGATSLGGTEFPNQLTFNLGSTVVTYTVSDASGNTRTCSYSVLVTDNQPVTVSCPSSQSFNTGSGTCTFVSTSALTPVVTDNCPVQNLSYTMLGASTATGTGTLSGFTFNKGLTLVTWKATDAGGSTATCSFFVTVNDREAPVVPADAGSTVNCLSAAVMPAAPPATDNCSGSVTGVLVSVVDNPSPLVCEGTRTYTYSYTDGSGNVASDTWVYTYTVNYNTALVPPASIINQTTCAAGAVNPGAPANIQDACGRTIVPVLVGSVNGPNNTACSGSVVWRYRYTACDGTTADWTCTWNYQDNQPPVANLPATGYETCFTSESGAFQSLLQVSGVTDNCTGTQALRSTASFEFVPYSDGNNCNDGNVIIRFKDECGNGPTLLTFTGIRIDNIAPVAVSFPNSTVQPVCIESLPVPNPAGVVASDNCDSSVSVSFEGDQLPAACQGVATRRYKLTDDCGNTRLVEQYFNIISDRFAPVMTPGTLASAYTTVAQGEAAAVAATTIADDCTPYGELNIQTAVTGVCPATITVTATDKCGHSSQINYTNICLSDIVSLSVPASNMTVGCENEQSELNTWLNTRGGAQVTGAGLIWTYTPVQFGPIDCVTHSKSAIVTFRAQSPYGSFVTTTATFTVRDNQAPVVQNIPPQILTCASQIPVSDTELVIATDNCDNSLTIKLFSSSSNGGFACGYSPRTELRTYSVTDDYCNTVYVTYQITAADNVPPTFTAPPNATVNIASNCSYDASVQITGDVTNEADNCSTNLNATFTDVTIQGGGPGIRFTINRTWRLTDNCGNSATPRVQTIHVIDNVPPALTCPANVNVTGATIGTSVCAWRGVNTTPVSSDNCGLPVVTYTITGNFAGASSGNKTVNGVIFLEGVSTVTYTSTDLAGNKTTCSFTVTVNCTTVSGRIIWEHNDVSGVKDVTVRLRKGTVLAGSVLSDLNGNYTLTPTSTGTHTITPVKNINRLNGVTAADATIILQHLNGSPLITDPYKKVAADVNRSGAISTQDANVITQALAGNASALAAFNVFWRFIPTTYLMPVTGPNVVATFPESITLNLTGADVTGQDFFGVKLGDLNGSANPLAAPATGPLVWTVRDEVLQAGKEYELQFAANGFSDLAAFQFGLDFDPSQLQFLSQSNTAAVPMSNDNFGAGNAGIGEFRVVWSNVDGVTLAPGTNVFKLRFKALETGMRLSEVIKLDDNVLECLAFTETMAQGPVRLVFTTTTATDTPESNASPKLQLMQNIPNPFVGVTTIGFILPDACEVVIRITDVSGREITRYQRQYSAGYHEMEFRIENAAGYGVLFYELITPYGTQSKKMITGSR